MIWDYWLGRRWWGWYHLYLTGICLASGGRLQVEANSSSCLVEGRPLRSPGGAGEGREEETGHWVTKASTLEGTGQRQSPGVLEWVGRVVVLRLGEVFQVITGRNKSPRRLLKQTKN